MALSDPKKPHTDLEARDGIVPWLDSIPSYATDSHDDINVPDNPVLISKLRDAVLSFLKMLRWGGIAQWRPSNLPEN